MIRPNDVHTAGMTLISRSSRIRKLLQNHANYLSGGSSSSSTGSSCQVCFHLTRYGDWEGEFVQGRTPDSKLLSCYIGFQLARWQLLSGRLRGIYLGQKHIANTSSSASFKIESRGTSRDYCPTNLHDKAVNYMRLF